MEHYVNYSEPPVKSKNPRENHFHDGDRGVVNLPGNRCDFTHLSASQVAEVPCLCGWANGTKHLIGPGWIRTSDLSFIRAAL